MEAQTNGYRSICDYNNHVSVLVGPAEQPFIVHKDIICAKSHFFQAACSERWLRSTEAEKKIKLPEVDAQVFQQYLSWVYSDKFDLSTFTSTHKDIPGLESSHRDVANCIELYLLGDKLDDIGLRDKTMETLVLNSNSTSRSVTVHRVWSSTPENAPIRRMIVDRAIALTKRDYFAQHLEEYPAEFIKQIALSLFQDTPTKTRKVFKAKLPCYLEQVHDANSDSSD